MGAAACVYDAHIESPSAPRRRPITARCAAVVPAIAARGISAIQIDFALGIAAPGGLTSGFALPI